MGMTAFAEHRRRAERAKANSAAAAVEASGKVPEEQHVEGVKLESLTRPKLDALAAELGLDTSKAANKAEAIAIIEASGKVPTLPAE